MADIKFNCPHCQQSLESPPELFGQEIECPSCQQSIHVPTPTQTSAVSHQTLPKINTAVVRQSSNKKKLFNAFLWTIFLPVGLLLHFLMQIAFAFGCKLVMFMFDDGIHIPTIGFILISLPIWCKFMAGVPIIACKMIAPRHKPASIIYGLIFVPLMAFLILGSKGFPIFVLINHILASLCLIFGIIAAYIDCETDEFMAGIRDGDQSVQQGGPGYPPQGVGSPDP